MNVTSVANISRSAMDTALRVREPERNGVHGSFTPARFIFTARSRLHGLSICMLVLWTTVGESWG
jgi:hypothetical protein